MDNEIIVVRGIDDVTRDIKTKTGQFLMSAIEIGQLLVEAKSMVAPGSWGEYVREKLPFSQSWANNYMRLYREYGSDQLGMFQSGSVAKLNPTQALELIALPEPQREAFLENNDVEGMSTRELRQAVKGQKVAQERADDLARRLEKANRENERLRKDAQQEAQKAKTEAQKADREASKLKKKLEDAKSAQVAAEKALEKMKASPEIPASTMEQLREEANAEAAKQAAEKYAVQLQAAQDKADAAEQARKEAEERLEKSRKTSILTDPKLVAVQVLGRGLLDSWATILEHYQEAIAENPEYKEPLDKYLGSALDRMRKIMEEAMINEATG